jgi:2-methylcitrate dehydratase
MLSKSLKSFSTLKLSRDSNQARGIGEYAIDFLKHGNPNQSVKQRTKLFHTDSVICGLSALALRTNAPTILKQDAIDNYSIPMRNGSKKGGATCFGSI